MEKQFLLDIRTKEEFKESHIEVSTNIPLQELSNNLEKIKNIT